MKILKFKEFELNESLPRQNSAEQLKRVMKQSAKTDIGNRISDMNKQGANIQYIQNPIDSGIESSNPILFLPYNYQNQMK
jgi:hypothetical protein